MEGKFLLLCAMFGLWLVEASEEVASSKVIADTNKGLSENPHGAKNASYFVNPKKFLTYEGQFDKIKSLGDEVRCKLHGSCSEKKHKVPRKINTKASKKSVASRPRDRMPDNHNNVLSPEALMNPVAGGILGGNEFSQQPGAASFGQQPQMNVKVPQNPMEQEEMGGGMQMGPRMQMGSQAQPMNLDQMQNAENEASIQNSIRAKMDFMDKANGPQMALPGMSGMKDLAPGGVPDGLPGDMMNSGGSRNFADIKSKENLLSGMGPGMASARDASSQDSGLNNEDIFKGQGDMGGGGGDEGQGTNEIKDLHKFLQAHPKYKARDEEEESERENAAFAETEAKAHESISGLNLGKEGKENYQNGERNENRLPEKEGSFDREEPRGPFGDEYDKEHSERSHGHPHHDGDKPEPNGLGPGMGMLKPGGPEVPRLENLLGGQPQGMFGTREQSLGGSSIPDMGGDGTGPYGLPTGTGAGRFVSDNNKNMMESNSDYNVPKTAFSGLWKDYMLTTQSQLAEKDPSANSRQIIHHPHHAKHDMKKRDFVKRAKTRKHANVVKKSKLTKRSAPEAPLPANSTATAQNETTPTTSANITTTDQQSATTKENLANTTAASASAPHSNDTLSVTFPSTGAPTVSGNTSNVIIANNQSSVTSSAKRSNDTLSVTFPSTGGSPTVSGNTSNVIIGNNQSTITKASKKSNLKTMDVAYRSNDLPPVYLTVRNGRKMLVVHPTAEFLSSLPRINFTESYSDKRAVGTPLRTKLVKHADVAKAPKVSNAKFRNVIPEKVKEEHDDDDNNDDDDDKENDDDDNSDENEGKENGDEGEDKEGTDSSVVKRSNIAYVSVPVISPDPDGILDHWVKEQTLEKNKLYRRDLTKNFDPRELTTKFDPTTKDFDPMSNTQNLEAPTNNQSPLSPNSNFPQEEFQSLNAPPSPMEQQPQQQQSLEQKSKPFFQQTHDSLPLPNEIQSLYKEYAAQGKSNFQYEPSRDEVAEELQFAQKQNANQQLGGKEHIQTMDTSDMQSPGTGHIQQQMDTQGMENGGNLPLNQASASRGSRTQAPWEGMLGMQGMQEAEGSKRSVKSAIVTSGQRGFGPITVEAKTADAPMSDA